MRAGNFCSQRRQQRSHVQTRPHLNHGSVLRPVGFVHRWRRRLSKVGVLRVLCHANHFLDNQGGASIDSEESLADRGFTRKVPPGETLVDDDGGRQYRLRVLPLQISSRNEGDSHRAQEPRRHRHVPRPIGIDRLTRDPHALVASGTREQPPAGKARGVDPRCVLQAFQQRDPRGQGRPLVTVQRRLERLSRRRGRHIHERQVARVEPEIGAKQFREARQAQTAHEQHDEAECDLRRNERPERTDPRRVPSSSRSQRVCRRGGGGMQGGRQPEHERHEDAHGAEEHEDSPVRLNIEAHGRPPTSKSSTPASASRRRRAARRARMT